MKQAMALLVLTSVLVAGCYKETPTNTADSVNIGTFKIHEITPNWKPGDKLLIRSAIDRKDIALVEHRADARIFIQPSYVAESLMIYVSDSAGVTGSGAKFDRADLSGVVKVESILTADKGVVVSHDGKALLTYEIGPDKAFGASI